jgi:hypothetical protein
MPNIMIHEEVGFFLKNKLNINSYNYYLGLLAPDAPNLNGFAEKKVRWRAHVRRKDLNDWRLSLKDFYQNNKEKYDSDFLIGYTIHILTDIVYDDILYLKVREEIIKDNYSKEESHNIMRNDMDKYYFNEIETIKEILNSDTISYNINGINKELLTSWKNKFINDNTKSNTSKYITKEILDILNEEVLEEINLIMESTQ